MSGGVAHHTLIVRPDNAGDVLLAGPAIRAVAAGSSRVTLWVGPHGRAVAELLPGVDAIVARGLPWIDLAAAPVDREWLNETIDTAASIGADSALILGSFHQSPLPMALVLRAAGVSTIAATSVDFPGSLLDVRHAVDDDIHEVERSLHLVRSAGFELPAGDDGRLRIRAVQAASPVPPGTPYVVVHPGSSVPARAWAPERNAAAVARLAADGWRVVVTGGPDEAKLTARVAGDHGLDLGGRTDWPTLARIIADTAVVVTGNTGPAHLAAAVGTPVVELFAPTVPAVRWHPWQVEHVLLGDQDIPCAGCRARTCPVAGHPCVDDVPIDDVTAAVRHLADHAGRSRRTATANAAHGSSVRESDDDDTHVRDVVATAGRQRR